MGACCGSEGAMGVCCGSGCAASPRRQSAKAKAMLLHVFQYYDSNGDGMVCKRELEEAIQQTGLTTDYFMQADTGAGCCEVLWGCVKWCDGGVPVVWGDKKGKINKDEFLNFFEPIPDDQIKEMKKWLLTKQSKHATEMLLEIFAKYDKNGDNLLSLAELSEGIQGTGLSVKYFMQADKDRDDRISPEEWLQFFAPIPENEIGEIKKWLTD